MDYMDFLNEFDSYEDWEKSKDAWAKLEPKHNLTIFGSKDLDTLSFGKASKFPPFRSNARSINDGVGGAIKDDRVNSPSHYTRGRLEAIDIIEDTIRDAPMAILGMLQAQALKYILRMWNKDNPEEDAQKAIWYLERLVLKMRELNDPM